MVTLPQPSAFLDRQAGWAFPRIRLKRVGVLPTKSKATVKATASLRPSEEVLTGY